MTDEPRRTLETGPLLEHLVRFPEDLRDIRRLQRRFRLTVVEVARALDALDDPRRLGFLGGYEHKNPHEPSN